MTMSMREIIARLEWEEGETEYWFERLDERGEDAARLTTSRGVHLQMPKAAWRQLAVAINRLFPSATTETSSHSKRSANTGKPWTADLDDELRRLWEGSPKSPAGMRQIATHFGRSRGGIESRLTKLGLLAPNAGERQQS